MAETWRERIGIRTPDVDNNILSLSGGNQQKALFARALGSDAGIVLMDDPMRGVDIGTKQEVYAMIRAEAEKRPHLHLVHDRDGRARATATTSMSSATAASSPTSRARDRELHPRRSVPASSSFAESRSGMRAPQTAPQARSRRASPCAPCAPCCRRCLARRCLPSLAIFWLQTAHDELCRPQPDAQSGDPDRARRPSPRCASSPSTTSTCRSAPMSASSSASPRPGCTTTPLLGVADARSAAFWSTRWSAR